MRDRRGGASAPPIEGISPLSIAHEEDPMPDPIDPASAAQSAATFRCLVLDPALLLAGVLEANDLSCIISEEVGPTRDRLFTPATTTALFLSQVGSDDHSCRGAVARLLAWRVARG